MEGQAADNFWLKEFGKLTRGSSKENEAPAPGALEAESPVAGAFGLFRQTTRVVLGRNNSCERGDATD